MQNRDHHYPRASDQTQTHQVRMPLQSAAVQGTTQPGNPASNRGQAKPQPGKNNLGGIPGGKPGDGTKHEPQGDRAEQQGGPSHERDVNQRS